MSSPFNLGVQRVSADPTWRTPSRTFEALDAEFDFTLDPCASAPIKPSIEYFTEVDNGLARSWSGRVFVNPPYGRVIADWLRKITASRESCEVIVGLLPCRTDSAWWHDHVMPADEIRFIRGRLHFEGVDHSPAAHNAPFPSCVVVWRPRT
ncbi:MAG: adenine methyltransferase [Chloroflexi bacterium]|nr:adenine methyltransferase [Chloroflexota bacterium]